MRLALIALAEPWIPAIFGLLGTVLGALITVLGGRFVLKPYESRVSEDLARLQSALAAEREERKALRDRLDAEEIHRFAFLHEKRVAVMGDIYRALCELDDAADDFSRSFAGFVGGPGPGDYWAKMREAGVKFRDAFWAQRLLFEEALAQQLLDLNRAYVAIVNTYGILLGTERRARDVSADDADMMRKTEYDALQKLYESRQYNDAVKMIGPLERAIETEFRRLYGTR